MSSKIKLKKSSIAGRVPVASDLDYGEVAINIADGKLYFKNSSNIVQSFEAGSFVDSASVIGLIDSAYVQARQTSEAGGLDSAEVNLLVADGLQHAFSRILVDGQFDVLADSTQDGLTFEAGHNITITTAPNDDTITFSTSSIGADSVTSLIDSGFVQARQDYAYASLTGAPTSLSPDGVDSSATIALIDSAYVQARQTIGSGFDSADVISLIDSAYVLARAPSQDFLDSAEALALIDSDYVFSRVSETNYTYQLGTDADSNNGTGLNYLSTAAGGHGVAIQPDGSALFVGDSRTVKVWGTPTTTWDVSTYSRQSNSDEDFTTHIGSNNITDFGFNDDGTRMYIINGGSVIRQFDLSIAYRPSTASYTSTDYYNPTDVANLNGFGFSNDGTKLILSSSNITSTLGSNADGVRSYTLSTAWDVTTATYDNKEIITGYRGDDYERTPMSSYFANNGKDFFIYGQQQRRVQHFPLAIAYDITSYTTRNQLDQMHSSGSYSNAVEIVFDQNLYIAVGNSNLGSVGFSSTGTRVGFNDLVRNLIDSDYVIARAPATGLDSSSTIALIDSSYVQARQTTADLTNYRTATQIESMIDSNVNAVIDAAPGALDTLNELAAALGDDANFSTTVTNSIAAKIDSAAASSIITADVDKTFVDALGINATQLNSQNASYYLDYNNFSNTPTLFDGAYSSLTGVPTSFAPAGVDSSATIALIDSAYVQARQTSDGGADSATVIAIVDSSYVQARQTSVSGGATTITNTTYIADSGDVTFNATYPIGKLNVYLNGILLVDSDDYDATNGSSVVLTTAADSGDTVQIVAYTTQAVGTLDSTGVTGLIDSAYVQARQTAQDFAYSSLTGTPTIPTNNNELTNGAGYITGYTVTEGDVTAHQAALTITESQISDLSHTTSLAFSDITSTPTTLAGYGITDAFDGAYSSLTGVPSTFEPAGVDSAATIALIDSAYISARTPESGVDSATTLAIIAEPKEYVGTTTYTVTVASKTSSHAYYNTGSSSGYFLDGIESPFIEFVSGQTYVFDQSDASNSNHPIRFYYDVDKTTEYTGGVTLTGSAGSSGANTTIIVGDDTPSRLYYQCQNHDKMGWAVGVDNHNVTGLTTDELTEGSTNRYFSDTLARGAFSGGTGVSISSGSISIGQPVGTSDNVQFGNVTVGGNLTVSGSTTYLNTETLTVDDNIIVLNNNVTGTPSENAGIEVERGTSTNVSLIWNEDSDKWKLTTDGTNYYDILTSNDTISASDATTLDGQIASYYLDYSNFTNTPTSITDFNITDGNTGQVLTTDGSGNFTFTTVSGGSGGGGVDGTTGVTQFKSTSTGSTLVTTTAGTFSDVQVFVNGILQRDSDDYSFNDSSGNITFTNAPETDAEITVYGYKTSLLNTDSDDNLSINGDLKVGNHSNLTSGTTTLSANSEGIIDTFDATTVRGAKFVITVENDSDRYQISEALVIHNGTTATITTYGTINTGTGNLAVFDAEYSSGSVNIKATPTTINTTYKVVRTDIII